MRDILYRFKADVSDFQSKAKVITDRLGGIDNEAQSMAQRIQNTMSKTGVAMTLGITAPLIAMSGVATKSGMEMETAMAGVSKTTDITGDDLKRLTREIQDMSHKIPVASTELANIAETAGQLGIEEKHLLSFTRTMADLGVATNMSSDEAATALARLANITGMPQTEFNRLGSSVVELGNNLATTEGEIVQMGLRLAGTGAQVGLTEAEILGLAGAMSSMGINAQAGGSAMSQTMQKINSEVLGGGENVEKFAKIAGMSASEFSETWKKEPIVALEAFIGGLGGINDAGGDVSGTLKDLEIGGLNQIDVLSRLSGGSELLSDAIGMSNEAWNENTALTEEAETAYATTANQIEMVKNRIETLMQRIGALLLPGIKNTIETITGWIDKLLELDDSQLQTIVTIAKVVGAIGPILIVVSKLIGFAVNLGTNLKKLNSAFQIVSGGANILSGAGGLLMLKFVAIIAVIAAVIAAGVWLYKNWDTVKEKATELWQSITEAWNNMKDTIVTKATEIWNSIKEWFTNLKTSFSEGWNTIKTTTVQRVTELVESVSEWFNTLPERLAQTWSNIKSGVLEWWEQIKQGFSTKVTEIMTGITNWVEGIKTKAQEIKQGFVDAIIDYFGRLPTGIMDFLGLVTADIIGWVILMVMKAYELGSQFLSTIIDWFAQLPERIGTWITSTYERISTWVSETVAKAVELGTKFITSISDWFSKLPERIGSFINTVYTNVTTWATKMWNKAKELGKNFVDMMMFAIKNLPRALQERWDLIYSSVTTWASKMWNKAKETGQNFLNSIVQFFQQLPGRVASFITNTYNRVATWASNMWAKARETGSQFISSITSFFQQLPGRIQTWLSNTISRVSSFVRDMGNKAREAGRTFMTNILNEARKIPSRIASIGKDIVRGIWNGIKSMGSWLSGQVGSFFTGFVDGIKNRLGIKSPSRVMRDEIGLMMVRGLGIGIEKNDKKAITPMKRMMDDVLDVWGTGSDDLNAKVNGMISGSIGTNLNMTENYIPVQSATLNFTLGNKSFTGFVEDISNAEGQNIRLEEMYAIN